MNAIFKNKYLYLNILILLLIFLLNAIFFYYKNNLKSFIDVLSISSSWFFLLVFLFNPLINYFFMPIYNISLFIIINLIFYKYKKYKIWYIFNFIFIIISLSFSTLFFFISSQ